MEPKLKMGHQGPVALQGKNKFTIYIFYRVQDWPLFCKFFNFAPDFQSASQEELCGGDRADGYHLHEQLGEVEAGTHEHSAGSHWRLQEHPA